MPGVSSRASHATNKVKARLKVSKGLISDASVWEGKLESTKVTFAYLHATGLSIKRSRCQGLAQDAAPHNSYVFCCLCGMPCLPLDGDCPYQTPKKHI